jgi:hypothetical protein
MPSLFDPDSENAKIIYMGDSGHGKTGSKAALIAAGYKLRMIDTDRGFRILRSLLTDSRYPYAAYIKKAGIDLTEPGRISYIPVDVPIALKTMNKTGTRESYNILAPTNSNGWSQISNMLYEWRDGDVNLGPVTDWDQDCILDIDTIGTAAELAKYWVQDINNRLGQLEDDHGRDSGDAQEMIRRLSTLLTNPSVKCNVIVTAHINWVDTTRGAPQNPNVLIRQNKTPDPRGFPQIIGQALSPVFGKRWNDLFIVRRTGGSNSTDRRIYTVPTDNVDAKNSAFLEKSYPLSTGLAEIFAALRYQDPPTELIKAIRGADPAPDSAANPDNKNVAGFSGATRRFGSRNS